MASLSLAPINNVPNQDLNCSICHESVRESEDTYRRLSYLDLATQPKYVVHEGAGENATHSWCFGLWAANEIRNNRIPKCVHCNIGVDRFNGRPINQIFGLPPNPIPADELEDDLNARWNDLLAAHAAANPEFAALFVQHQVAANNLAHDFARLGEQMNEQGAAHDQWFRGIREQMVANPGLADEVQFGRNCILLVNNQNGTEYASSHFLNGELDPGYMAGNCAANALDRVATPIAELIKNGDDPEQLRNLLQETPVSKGIRSMAVLEATRLDRLDLVQVLLENGPIQQIIRDTAIETAQRKGFLQIARARGFPRIVAMLRGEAEAVVLTRDETRWVHGAMMAAAILLANVASRILDNYF